MITKMMSIKMKLRLKKPVIQLIETDREWGRAILSSNKTGATNNIIHTHNSEIKLYNILYKKKHTLRVI